MLTLVGCGTAQRVDDAGVDAHELPFDAAASHDATLDAPPPDPDAFWPEPDVYWPPDAIRTERCNAVDEDDDMRIDEGAEADCRLAPHAPVAACIMGACACRAEGASVHAGDYGDCNADFRDGCETPLGTATNCGACGEICSGIETCTESATGGFGCRPMGILDFSVARRGGPIACVVELDGSVLCRGPNTFFAISDTSSETALLDWTPVDLPTASVVHASERMLSDGRTALSICVLDDTQRVVCRGDNGMGLFGLGDRGPHRGVHVVPVPEGATTFFTWGGEGYALLPNGPVMVGGLQHHDVWRWGGADARSPVRWLTRAYDLQVANMPVASVDPFPALTDWFVSWGPHRDFLSMQPEGTSAWTSPTALPAYAGYGLACADDVCCEYTSAVQCWGRRSRRDRDDAARAFSRAGMSNVRVAPMGDHVEVCVGFQLGPDRELSSFACTNASALADAPSDTIVEMSPRFAAYSATVPSARVDWQAMCLQRRPDWWQCWGTHDGWGHE